MLHSDSINAKQAKFYVNHILDKLFGSIITNRHLTNKTQQKLVKILYDQNPGKLPTSLELISQKALQQLSNAKLRKLCIWDRFKTEGHQKIV